MDAKLQAAIEAATTARPRTPTDNLWLAVFGALPSRKAECSEWLKFVNLSYAVVLGTNDNERTHSRMKLLRTALRSTLALDNLAAALRYILHPTRIPPIRAFKVWVVGRRNSDSKRQRQ